MKSGNRTSSNPIDTADAPEIRRSPPVILMKPYKKQVSKILHLNWCNGRISKPSTSQPSSPRHPKTIEENSKRPNARREENTPQTTTIEILQGKRMAPKKISSFGEFALDWRWIDLCNINKRLESISPVFHELFLKLVLNWPNKRTQ